jgi:dihydroorotate dehydrogenase (fumarate)
MGIEIENPVILGASNLVTDPDMLKRAEEQGAAAIVYKSLFEQEMQLEEFQLDEKLTEFNDMNAEMLTTHPNLKFAGPDEHLLKLRNAKESISIPLIASLNCVNKKTWISYAKMIAETGVDAIELNFYHTPSDFNIEAKQIEDEQINIVKEICKSSPIPVSVKLSPDYSNLLNFVQKLDKTGITGVVLFNSFYQPDIDISTEKHTKLFNFSNEGDYRNSLRYAGLLFKNIQADVCSSRGVFSSDDVIRLLLAGSTCVQVVSTIYKKGLAQIGKIKTELSDWMESKNYNNLEDFRGNLSKISLHNDPFVYQRAQYVDLLIHSDEIVGIPK